MLICKSDTPRQRTNGWNSIPIRRLMAWKWTSRVDNKKCSGKVIVWMMLPIVNVYLVDLIVDI